jgi:hypothetical protein
MEDSRIAAIRELIFKRGGVAGGIRRVVFAWNGRFSAVQIGIALVRQYPLLIPNTYQVTAKQIVLGKQRLTVAEENQLAVNDGFSNAAELRTFFRSTYGFPLPGKPHWVSWR